MRSASQDPEFLALYDEAIAGLDQARAAKGTWWAEHGPALNGKVIAYFSAEFALHQSLPIYAGGLGVLAGDHCKEASDLGVPLVGVGFMYPQGYFHQRISNEGWQQEHYERLKWTDAPIEAAITRDGKPAITAVPLGDRTVLAAVWRVRVGRVRLFLLDTDLEENAPWDRELSARLYGGDRETRIQQEIILGIGGVRVLRALGIEPAVWHLNEGHAAFVALQRIRELVEKARRSTTPWRKCAARPCSRLTRPCRRPRRVSVPPGREAPGRVLGRDRAVPAALPVAGRIRQRQRAAVQHDGAGAAHRRARQRRQRAHGQVTRAMWQPIWPDLPSDEVPVKSITNGVHVPTWIAAPILELFNRHLGPSWLDHHDEPEFWDGLPTFPTRTSGRPPNSCVKSCSCSSASACASAGRPSASARFDRAEAARCWIRSR